MDSLNDNLKVIEGYGASALRALGCRPPAQALFIGDEKIEPEGCLTEAEKASIAKQQEREVLAEARSGRRAT